MQFETLVKREKGSLYKCDHCNCNFEVERIELTDPIDDFQLLTPFMAFRYVDKDGNVTGGQEQPSKKKGDKLLTCPICGTPHLFGFDRGIASEGGRKWKGKVFLHAR